MLHLTQINIYPIKSARGISLPSAQLDDKGLQFDRRWMVVDEQGLFLSQRTLPRMALIEVSVQHDHLSITSRGFGELNVPLQFLPGAMREVQVWNDLLNASDIGQVAAAWFTELLGVRCRLVQLPEEPSRFVNPKYDPTRSAYTFADAFPILLLTEMSLGDLNARLAAPVPMNRFRPNLVVDGTFAFEEDTWQRIQIGEVTFRVVKPCGRCTVPTVNQETGEAGKEPIRTLSTYRTRDSMVYFGQNLIHERRGVVSVGDEVHVLTD